MCVQIQGYTHRSMVLECEEKISDLEKNSVLSTLGVEDLVG